MATQCGRRPSSRTLARWRYESRQVIDASPEPVDLTGRQLQTDRLADVNAVIAPSDWILWCRETYLCGITEQSIHESFEVLQVDIGLHMHS
jgi:hypothetical protein